jgi:hypothetical protein
MYHTIIKTLIFALNAKTGCASEVKKTSFFVILSACTTLLKKRRQAAPRK